MKKNENKHIYSERIHIDFSCSTETTPDYSLHCHDRYEIYFYLGGSVSYLVEGKRYDLRPNTILLLSPQVFHGVKVHETNPYIRYAMHFYPSVLPLEDRKLLLNPFFLGKGSPDICYENVQEFRMKEYFDDILECRYMEKNLQEIAVKLRVANLLTQIAVMSQKKKNISIPYQNETVRDIIEYLNLHLCEKITLDQLSVQFFQSKSSLNHLFRKSTGTTLMDYVIHKRLAFSRQLISLGMSAGEAALQVGFSEYSSFYKAYRKVYGVSPTERERHK